MDLDIDVLFNGSVYKTVKAHRVVLAAASSGFRRMVERSVLVTSPVGPVYQVHEEVLSVRAFEALIELIYSGQLAVGSQLSLHEVTVEAGRLDLIIQAASNLPRHPLAPGKHWKVTCPLFFGEVLGRRQPTIGFRIRRGDLGLYLQSADAAAEETASTDGQINEGLSEEELLAGFGQVGQNLASRTVSAEKARKALEVDAEWTPKGEKKAKGEKKGKGGAKGRPKLGQPLKLRLKKEQDLLRPIKGSLPRIASTFLAPQILPDSTIPLPPAQPPQEPPELFLRTDYHHEEETRTITHDDVEVKVEVQEGPVNLDLQEMAARQTALE